MNVEKIKEIVVAIFLCAGLALLLYLVSSSFGGSKLGFADYALIVGGAYWWRHVEIEKEKKRGRGIELLHERLLKAEDDIQFMMNRPLPSNYNRDEF